MQAKRLEELLEGWGQGNYTPQEMITHLLKNAKETAETINHHVRMIALMDKRLTDLEEELERLK